MNPSTSPLAAFIGIDWADRSHQVCWRRVHETNWQHLELEQTPEAIAQWAASLQHQFGGQAVGVCLEQSRGPLVYALSAYPWIVLYPINPKSLARYREALAPSRAKDDPSDAQLLGQFLALHQGQLRAWKAEDAATRRLRWLLENRETLVDERTRLAHRLKAVLKSYYPQALDWAGPLTKPMAWAFLLRWPRLELLQRAKQTALLKFFYAHQVRRGDQISEAYGQIQQAVALVHDEALVETSELLVQSLCKQLQALEPFIARHNEQIAALFAAHPERALFEALPGAGAVLGPRLAVAFGTDRDRFVSEASVQQLSGIAPVTERSGRACWVHWRWAANSFLRQTFHEFALHSRRQSVWARLYYDQLRQQGKDHHASVRALAFKWIRILYRCWKDRTPYDEQRYCQALRRQGSPLAALIDRELARQEAV
jgi:transposase